MDKLSPCTKKAITSEGSASLYVFCMLTLGAVPNFNALAVEPLASCAVCHDATLAIYNELVHGTMDRDPSSVNGFNQRGPRLVGDFHTGMPPGASV